MFQKLFMQGKEAAGFFSDGRRHRSPGCEAPGRELPNLRKSVSFCLVQEVDAEQNRNFEFQNLQDQIEASFQASGVADGDHSVCLTGTEKFPGDFFLRGMGQQGIAAGKIHQRIGIGAVPAGTSGTGDGLAGPVSRVLTHAGQSVEQGALSHIGVSARARTLCMGMPPSLRIVCMVFFPVGEEMDSPGVFSSKGEDGSTDEVGGGIAQRAAVQTFDFVPRIHPRSSSRLRMPRSGSKSPR